MQGNPINPTGWLPECQLMCLIQASLKEGVSPEVPLKSFLCIKVKCSRNLTLSAQAGQNKSSKPTGAKLSSSETVSDQPPWQGKLLQAGEPLPTTPTAMSGARAVLVPLSYLAPGWGSGAGMGYTSLSSSSQGTPVALWPWTPGSP